MKKKNTLKIQTIEICFFLNLITIQFLFNYLHLEGYSYYNFHFIRIIVFFLGGG